MDRLGNVMGYRRAVSDSAVVLDATYEYDAFGREVRSTGPASDLMPYRFSTKYTDADSGLVYYGYRFYDPDRGRWINRDPIGEEGELCLYSFLHNAPTNAYDILGEKQGQEYDTEEAAAEAGLKDMFDLTNETIPQGRAEHEQMRRQKGKMYAAPTYGKKFKDEKVISGKDFVAHGLEHGTWIYKILKEPTGVSKYSYGPHQVGFIPTAGSNTSGTVDPGEWGPKKMDPKHVKELCFPIGYLHSHNIEVIYFDGSVNNGSEFSHTPGDEGWANSTKIGGRKMAIWLIDVDGQTKRYPEKK